MKSFRELADSVVFDLESTNVKIVDKDVSLELIGEGRSAFVFKIKATNLAIKVFFPPHTETAMEESAVYQILNKDSHYPSLYEAGQNYLVIDLIIGETLFECLNELSMSRNLSLFTC